MEAHKAGGAANPAHRGGLEDEPCRPVGVEGGGDDAGGGGEIPQFLGKLRLTQHQAVHIHLQSPADHIRLVSAQDDGIGGVEQEILPALGQGDGHFPCHYVGVFSCLVENLSLQHGEDVEKGHGVQFSRHGLLHVVAGHILPGEHTVQGAVLIGYGDGGDVLLLLEHPPGSSHRDPGAEHRRGVKIQILHLGVHIPNPLGGLESEQIQHNLGFVGHMAQAGGLILPISHGVPQGGVGHGRHNGVGVRVPMPGYVNGIHRFLLNLRRPG